VEKRKEWRLTMTNNEFSKQERFIKACEAAGIKPTARQASKLRNLKGTLYPILKSVMANTKEKGE
jgi:hypothetical protein